MESLTVTAPATVANLACGYDLLGLAVDSPVDTISIEQNDIGKIRILSIECPDGDLPFDPKLNTAGIALASFIESAGIDIGLDVSIEKGIPLSGGMGSSAASAVGAVFAAEQMLGSGQGMTELLSHALKAEMAVSGTGHADNAGPCLFGGIALVRSYSPLEIIPIHTDLDLYITLANPDTQVRTKDARSLIPENISISTSTAQSGNLAGLINGLHTSDTDMISRSMQDYIAEPARAKLIPGYEDVKSQALSRGALACNISGSGPTVFSLSSSLDTAEAVGDAMSQAFTDHGGVSSNLYISKINTDGPRVL